MDIEQFLEEYKNIDIRSLDREQQELFKEIMYENSLFEESMEIAKVIYEQNKDEIEAIESYVHSLMQLEKKDEALYVLYEAEQSAPILYLEGLIYAYDGLLEIGEDKFLQAKKLTSFPPALVALDKELAHIYLETGRLHEAYEINKSIFESEKDLENFKILLNTIMTMGTFEDVIELYNKEGRQYNDAEVMYIVAFSYNQMQDIENSKNYLLKTIELNPEMRDAYLHLGHICKGEESIKYLEKYIELQGLESSAYIHLIDLYAENKEYDKIRILVQNVLKEQGISEETLFIAISALRSLYEQDKVYKIYNENPLVKDDPTLLSLALFVLSEEEDYVDFVADELIAYSHFIQEEPYYYEALRNVYELTNNSDIANLLARADGK